MVPTPRQWGHASLSACASLDGGTILFPKSISSSLRHRGRFELDSGLGVYPFRGAVRNPPGMRAPVACRLDRFEAADAFAYPLQRTVRQPNRTTAAPTTAPTRAASGASLSV